MTGRRRRGLSADDRRVWEAVARTARRRAAAPPVNPVTEGDSRPETVTPPQRPTGSPAAADLTPPPTGTGSVARSVRRGAAHGPEPGARDVAAPVRGGGYARNTAPQHPVGYGDPLPGPVGRPEAGLDRRTAERLRKGAREPDARLDLHGLTAEQAHRRLDRFLAGALAQGLRMVLVITGKGGRRAPEDAPWLPEGRGVLRDAAPRWIRQGPHGRRIVGIYEAHIRHGGTGAFYVYLRKNR